MPTKRSNIDGWELGLKNIEDIWLHICEASEAMEWVWDLEKKQNPNSRFLENGDFLVRPWNGFEIFLNRDT